MDKQLLIRLVLIFFLIVNSVAFFVMFLDKRRSGKKNAERIPEGVLFFMAAIFGGVGIYAGMFALRHKTHKWYFLIGVPVLILQNCLCLYFVFKQN